MTGRPNGDPDGRDPVDDATLALLLEVAGTPKPGNVDRERDLTDLRFESFLGGSIGARAGLESAARGEPLGPSFERAVRGMADRAGTNTQFGCLLLLTPLLAATVDDTVAPSGTVTPEAVDRVVRRTTVADAVAFYTAFEHVDVAVDDPPVAADALDVRRGGSAASTLRERGVTLREVMELGAEPGGIPDRNAQEWVEGFPRTVRIAERILADEGAVTDRAARAFIYQLAREPDTLVATNHDADVARETSRRAASVIEGIDASSDDEAADPPDPLADHVDLAAATTLAEAFVDGGINPGTTADLVCAGLYVALRRGLEVRA
ncbi:triphosphoribosyl-dephospho-CoA synthase [Halorubrum vacuolatum]|uniref:Triphosphoribosyl-dephospho-CoA synthase n=1 Tax=Halorubrum vacuolatum TaxID=63740 RepID=A0A238WWJ7_HALVU|nr:triphosphoribosyl-dephospho-CoA synthase [Halorubrum vacuolatum]SNR50594.1 triphosphoribosyl-dephospho-CoA synthase [Halorubrum vacuolatum]